ncbi:MAG: RDD family protein [Rariglobus sp.]|nr:RDD family protein [Rariglobus sp.]
MSTGVRRLRVTTPEGVEFSFRIASPVLRLGALMIDWAVVSSAWSVVAMLLKPLQLISADAGTGVMIVTYFVLSRGYDILMDYGWRGQTLGKRVMRLRVVDARGLRLTFAQCVLRNLLRFIDSLPFAYAVGGVASLMNTRGQRLGDLAAGTIVVHEALEPAPDATVMGGQRYNSLRGQAALVARLRRESSPEEARAAWQALARREQIEPVARLTLYADLAAHFRRIGHIPDALVDGLTDEQQVRNVVDVLYR